MGNVERTEKILFFDLRFSRFENGDWTSGANCGIFGEFGRNDQIADDDGNRNGAGKRNCKR